ncbi:MAG: ATP-binding protein [Paracoccaceae bacterium]
MTRTISVIIYVLAVAVLAVSVWFYAARESVDEFERRGQSDLALATDRLVSSILSYRLLAVTLSGDPRLISLATPAEELTEVLERTADLSGALDLVLLDREREVRASAFGHATLPWVNDAWIERAFHGALGSQLVVSETFGRRAMLLAVPIFSEAGPVLRTLVVVIDLERIEADFRGSQPAVLMTDSAGVIFFSNRSELMLRDKTQLGLPPSPVPDLSATRWLGANIWSISAGRYVPRRAIVVEQDLSVIGMSAVALVDLRPALATATLQAAVTGFAFLLFGMIVFLVGQQRRALAAANEALEGLVSARTQELSNTNVALRAEVAERIEAETALKKAQSDLIQAEKLSALGKMSAGISHELNQPLMAVQSFAQNGSLFLERGDTDKAAANFSRVGDLAARMARIIRNFRAFARQERETVGRVNLVESVVAAVDLAETRLGRHGVALTFEKPSNTVWVQGGEVRLQQVVLNLISNAIDAMYDAPVRDITVAVEPGQPVVLRVSDTGPGIEEPDKVFEPFYSTKSIGEAEGVGLGLSISYGLVQSFGGEIKGTNAPEGGAVFTVELQPWQDEETS